MLMLGFLPFAFNAFNLYSSFSNAIGTDLLASLNSILPQTFKCQNEEKRGALQGQGAALLRSAASLALGYIYSLASLETRRSVLAVIWM